MPEQNSSDTDIVMVPVPRSALPAVYRALADALQPSATPVERGAVVNNADWSEQQVRQLCFALTTDQAQKAFGCVAAGRGRLITYEAMAQAAGLHIDELRTQLAWFSKRCKQVRGVTEWPIEVVRDTRKPKGQRFSYRMNPRIAEWWLAAEAERSAAADHSEE